MTKKDVLYYYENRSSNKHVTEFFIRFTEEYKKKKWNPAFIGMLNMNVFEQCVDELCLELDIVRVERLSTKETIKLT